VSHKRVAFRGTSYTANASEEEYVSCKQQDLDNEALSDRIIV
jgi:hypothetical protein